MEQLTNEHESTHGKDFELKGLSPGISSAEATAAQRIREKREQQRTLRLLRMKHAALVILFLFSIGLTCYAVSEFSIPWISHHSKNASASELAAHENQRIYERFASVADTGLSLSLPAKIGDVIAVGFHEAERQDAEVINPAIKFFDNESTTTVRNAVINSLVPVLFVMNTRARGSSATSAMDIVLKPNAEVLSPVDGVVTKVCTYCLYGKVTDYRVEIQPDGFPNLHVAIIHIKNVAVAAGQKVIHRKTPIASMRPLPEIQSQVIKYLPEPEDHVHIQVNPTSIDIQD
ncbi:MAG TPA: M23 family metallopeptidase [Candidatus Aquicultor sp.]|jgi:hypothetical protein